MFFKASTPHEARGGVLALILGFAVYIIANIWIASQCPSGSDICITTPAIILNFPLFLAFWLLSPLLQNPLMGLVVGTFAFILAMVLYGLTFFTVGNWLGHVCEDWLGRRGRRP